MNRKDIQEQIRKHLPRLLDEEQGRWYRAEELGKKFVKDFPPSKIASLRLDEYVIGKGADNPSFCYRLERELDDLGRITGSPAIKFGVYYSKSTGNYLHAKKWGESVEEAFAAVRAAIPSLLLAASKKDISALNDNLLPPLIKGKLLYLYYQDEYMPIYSENHLKYFVAELNLHANPNSGVEMQRALMEYRATLSELKKVSPLFFMRILYLLFPEVKNPEIIDPEKSKDMPLLDEATSGASFIEEMPALSTTTSTDRSRTTSTKPDYEKQQKQRTRIGNRGEAIVIDIEKKRLVEKGRADLAGAIKHISEESDREGYDIFSYDEDGTPRHIEVKATTASNLDRGFYISNNELEKSKNLPNYYIYIVFSALSKAPKILPIKKPALHGTDFNLEPVAYHVTLYSENS